MKSFCFALFALNILLLQVSGLKLKKNKNKKEYFVQKVRCWPTQEECEENITVYSEFRDKTKEFPGSTFTCATDGNKYCLFNVKKSFEYYPGV